MDPNPPAASASDSQHAVVIGASMAGLLAARVLCNHFERVTLIERDQLPDSPSPRNGVPQARHAHILLVRGRQILDQLFPGLIDTLVTDGAVQLDTAQDLAQLGRTGWTPRFVSGMDTISVSRDLLEWRVRQRLLSDPRVSILEQHDAVGLIAAPDGKSLSAVQTRARGENSAVQNLPAAVIIDASGRSSHAADWLTKLGYAAPNTTTINAFLGYASRIYAIPENAANDWKAILMQARAPELARAGAILPIEGNRWIVTLAGYGRDFPANKEAEYLEFARSLAGPEIYDSIRNAAPLTPISGYQRTENQMRHYEVLDRFPENFFILGDSLCAFNPVYGQGMTNAALGALALDAELRGERAGAGLRFQKRLAQQNSTPWLMATSEDFRFPTTEGKRPGFSSRFVQWYISRVLDTLVDDREVFRVFIGVTHLVTPPSALFQPNIMLRVLRHSLTRPGDTAARSVGTAATP